MYRAGSRIRVRISAPNGDQPIWSFGETDPPTPAGVNVGYGGDMPSRLDLPVVPGVSTTTGLPPCPGLRGEPCRDYQAFTNSPGSLGTGGASTPTPSKCKKRKKRHHHHRRAAASKKKHKKKRCHRKKKHRKHR